MRLPAVEPGTVQRAVGANVRRLREGRGLSQEAFARELDYHRTYIGGVERGERNLTLQSVERLARALDVAPWELLQPSESVTDPG